MGQATFPSPKALKRALHLNACTAPTCCLPKSCFVGVGLISWHYPDSRVCFAYMRDRGAAENYALERQHGGGTLHVGLENITHENSKSSMRHSDITQIEADLCIG